MFFRASAENRKYHDLLGAIHIIWRGIEGNLGNDDEASQSQAQETTNGGGKMPHGLTQLLSFGHRIEAVQFLYGVRATCCFGVLGNGPVGDTGGRISVESHVI